jgi:hypothetical protein
MYLYIFGALGHFSQQRKAWADHVNKILESVSHGNIKIDHRTLEAQGITDRIPQIHLGPQVTPMRKKGITTDKGDIYQSIEEANREIKTLELSLKIGENLIEENYQKIPQSIPQKRRKKTASNPIPEPDSLEINLATYLHNKLINQIQEIEDSEISKTEKKLPPDPPEKKNYDWERG